MQYKNFLFDWDGSLADTLPIWFEGYKKVFLEHGIKVSNEIISRDVLGDWTGPEKLGILDSNQFFDELEKEVLEKINNAKLNQGACEVLEEIKKRGGKIAVVTASKKRLVKTALRSNGLRELVDVFIGKEDVEYVKPDPESLFKALKFLGGGAGESIMIGDNGKDILAGRAAGMDTCLYFPKKYEEFYKKETQLGWKATYFISDLSEIRKFL